MFQENDLQRMAWGEKPDWVEAPLKYPTTDWQTLVRGWNIPPSDCQKLAQEVWKCIVRPGDIPTVLGKTSAEFLPSTPSRIGYVAIRFGNIYAASTRVPLGLERVAIAEDDTKRWVSIGLLPAQRNLGLVVVTESSRYDGAAIARLYPLTNDALRHIVESRQNGRPSR